MLLRGFSSGALAKGDFRQGVALQRKEGIRAIELSALREHEFWPLLESIPSLDLDDFAYVSVHAPSRLIVLTEHQLVDGLMGLPENWTLVVHPDVITEPATWRRLGSRLCIENMDLRKAT